MTVELLNCDCMEYMAGLEDNAFDLAVVDPEYGIDLQGPCQHFEQYGTLQKINKNPPDKHYFNELQRISIDRIICGGNFFNLAPTRCFIVWDKGETMYGRSFAECEMAWTSFKQVARIFKLCPNQAGRWHPCQKPIALYNWLLQNYAKKGQRILDTHLGSGSSAIAAHYFGCDFVGCEIDVDYYDAACKRFDEGTRQLRMFAA